MKETIYTFILILFISQSNFAQITGQLYQGDIECILVQTYLSHSNEIVESDFDGYFELPISKELKSVDLVFDLFASDMKIILRNMELDTSKLDLGTIYLPSFKSLTIDEFEKLTALEKEGCNPIYCHFQLLGYYNTNRLSEEFLTLNCNKEINEFVFNTETKTVSIDWDLVKNCK